MAMDRTSHSKRRLTTVMIMTAPIVLAGCGGSSSSGTEVTPEITTASVAGTAAIGAAISDAAVSARCEDGSGFINSVMTDSSGRFKGEVGEDALPCALRVQASNGIAYHSLAIEGETTNITPLTDLAIALTGEAPDQWFNNGNLSRTAEVIPQRTQELVASLQSRGYSVPDNFDPLHSELAIGDVHDKVLDQLGEAIENTVAFDGFEELLVLVRDGNLSQIPEAPGSVEPPAPIPTPEPTLQFSDPIQLSANNAYWFSIFDIDGDGDKDIVTPIMEGDQWTGYTNTVVGYLNGGNQSFSHQTIAELEYGASYISLFEVPKTNSLGFFVPTQASCSIDYYQSNDAGEFLVYASVPSISCGNRYVLAEDLNGDEIIDSISNQGYINLGEENGGFSTPDPLMGLTSGASLALGDLNQDGAIDAASFDGNRTLAVFIGNGDGSFNTATLSLAPDNGCSTSNGGIVVLRDVNNDGTLDAVTADNCDITTFLGNGDGTFGDPITATSSSHVLTDYAIGDIDGDGIPDLILAEYNQETSVTLYSGLGDGAFEYLGQVDTGAPDAMRVEVEDMNNDGLLDVITSHGYHNTIGVVFQAEKNAEL